MQRFCKVMLVAVVLLVGGTGWAADVPSDYACLRIYPAPAPSVFMEFQANHMRMATSPELLTKAAWVTADEQKHFDLETGQVLESYTFPEQALPVKIPTVTSATILWIYQYVPPTPKATKTEMEPVSSSFSGRCRLEQRDASGTTWAFVVFPAGSVKATPTWEKANTARIPDLSTLSLRMETKAIEPTIEKPNAIGLGLRLQAMGESRIKERIFIREAWKGKTPAPIHLVVTDERGKVVDEKDGDLETFGYT